MREVCKGYLGLKDFLVHPDLKETGVYLVNWENLVRPVLQVSPDLEESQALPEIEAKL